MFEWSKVWQEMSSGGQSIGMGEKELGEMVESWGRDSSASSHLTFCVLEFSILFQFS